MTEWTWKRADGDEMEASIVSSGVRYVGFDWVSLSGGAYSAGFQSFQEFLSRGGLFAMPAEIQEAIRTAIEALPPAHEVLIEIAGPLPDEIHCQLDGENLVLQRVREIFRGSLAAGNHRLEGVLLYPGSDSRGRRNMRKFCCEFSVPEQTQITISETEPRWPDPD